MRRSGGKLVGLVVAGLLIGGCTDDRESVPPPVSDTTGATSEGETADPPDVWSYDAPYGGPISWNENLGDSADFSAVESPAAGVLRAYAHQPTGCTIELFEGTISDAPNDQAGSDQFLADRFGIALQDISDSAQDGELAVGDLPIQVRELTLGGEAVFLSRAVAGDAVAAAVRCEDDDAVAFLDSLRADLQIQGGG